MLPHHTKPQAGETMPPESPPELRQRQRPKKPKAPNAIEAAIISWFGALPSADASQHDVQSLISRAPKRWVVYEPMVLLPAGSFGSPAWLALLTALSPSQTSDLWAAILAEITSRTSKVPLTHLAANEGIPLHVSGAGDGAGGPEKGQENAVGGEDGGPALPATAAIEEENILRSPSGLRILYGDFGPSSGIADEDYADDFTRAFWVSARQNGIYQTWAPRWTMFSRGNVTEKARLLSFHTLPSSPAADPPPSFHERRALAPAALRDRCAVDLYAGIGYFTFSYAALGMRVLCWELNPWSVEGLRRGAEANGWSVRVVRGAEELAAFDLAGLLRAERRSTTTGQAPRIIVFQESNECAMRRLAPLLSAETKQDQGPEAESPCQEAEHPKEASEGDGLLEVRHVNCGFLPTSEPTWEDAWEMTHGNTRGSSWLHLHENVGVHDMERRRAELQGLFDRLRSRDAVQRKQARSATVEHIEQVKTYAPGVWHCVFDVRVDLTEGRADEHSLP